MEDLAINLGVVAERLSKSVVHSHLGYTPLPGSYPGLWSQVLSWRYPSSRFFPRSPVPSPFLGVPHSWLGVLQSWLVGTQYQPGGTPGLGYCPSLDRTGVPHWLVQDWHTTPSQDRTGVPLPHKTEQQSEYLLCNGWYASCSHAGGLSSSIIHLFLPNSCRILPVLT